MHRSLRVNKSSPNHHSDDSDVPMFVRRKKKRKRKKRADPCAFKAFQQLSMFLKIKKTCSLFNLVFKKDFNGKN